MYIRYELMVDGEAQGVGFLRGLDDTGLDLSETELLTKPFDDELFIPDLYVQSESWFTEFGDESFRDAIDDVIDAYNRDGLFEVERREQENLDGEILHSDEYQVIVAL